MRNFFRVLSILLLVCWMGLIFLLSSQTADESSQVSGSLIAVIAEKIYPDFDDLTESQQQEIVSSFQFIARKSAHAAVFAVLGFFAFLSFISYVNLRFSTRIFWAILISAIYAASDEFHQHFVVGRSCELRDFLIDFCGILVSVLICALFVKIIRPLRRKTAYVGKINKIAPESLLLQEQFETEDIIDIEREMLQESCAFEGEAVTEIKPMENEIKKEPVKLNDEMEYGASVIGQTVLEVTKLCNKLTAVEADVTRKELVNLALGRTEVLKAEILKIISMEASFEEKKALMQKEQQSAYDYFDSIMAQTS